MSEVGSPRLVAQLLLSVKELVNSNKGRVHFFSSSGAKGCTCGFFYHSFCSYDSRCRAAVEKRVATSYLVECRSAVCRKKYHRFVYSV